MGAIPNFDRVIEPHSWLRGWSRITKFIFKMADGRHIAKCWKRHNSPINGPIWMKLWLSNPIMSPTAYQQRIVHSAVMGVWRPNAWTNSKLGSQRRCETTVMLGLQQLWSDAKSNRRPYMKPEYLRGDASGGKIWMRQQNHRYQLRNSVP